MSRPSGNASTVLAILLALSSALIAHGQKSQCSGTPSSPGDASLRLTLKGGQTVFHQGEIIALTAEYTADASKKYLVNTRNCDRSGRLSGEEIFCLEPDRSTDPLYDYFHSSFGFFMGGLSSEQDPGRQPLTVDLELNEWKSLPPGSYRLIIVGNRLSVGKEGDATSWHNTVVPLRSNAVAFEVQPADSAWQALQLANATGVLDSPDATEQEKKHAARVLRFLGSEASTRELARRYGSGRGGDDWEFKFGLYGSPYREVAVQAMKAELSDPEHPVTREYVSTLVALELSSDPKLRLPPYDPNRQDEWRRAWNAYNAEVERRTNEYLQQASAVPRDPAALAMTASEMLQSGLALSPEAKTHWRQALVVNWSTLPVEKRNELIEYRWAEVGGPEWLPVLEQIVEGPPNPRRMINQPNRATALLRMWQVSPEEARSFMLREMAKPHGDIGIGVLGQLRERTFSQFESSWLESIRQGGAPDVAFQLVDRYGSDQILPTVQSIYEEHRGRWACVPQTAMLRYFLRVKPDYGVKELTASLALRNTTGCYRTQLSSLGEFAHMPQVEIVARQQLDDPEASVARDAAQALQRYGSPAAEKALWARLEKFHQQWKDKSDQLLHPRPGMIICNQDSGLEQALVQGILLGQSWFPDAETIRRLKGLSSPAMQSQIDGTLQMLKSGEFSLDMRWWPEDNLNYTIGWYSGEGMAGLKEKLGQFPPGSHFRAVTTKAVQEAHQAEFNEAEQAASANGQNIEVLAPR